jgi:hypothetical protein
MKTLECKVYNVYTSEFYISFAKQFFAFSMISLIYLFKKLPFNFVM